MPTKYNYYNPSLIKTSKRISTVSTSSRTVVDAQKVFSKISPVGDRLSVWCHEVLPSAEYKKYDIELLAGKRNHIQGIQRLNSGSYLAMSGCTTSTNASHLFIAALPSRHTHLPWRSNCLYRNRPSKADELLVTVGINESQTLKQYHGLTSTHWHAGGIANAGDLLAVPVEGWLPTEGSKVLLFDLEKPEQPSVLKFYINRPGKKSGAVALYGSGNGDLFMAVLYAEGETKKLDFYSFDNSQLHKVGNPDFDTFDCSETLSEPGYTPDFGEYQSIQFIAQNDGRLFLVGFHNVGMAGHAGTPNVADLFKVTFHSIPQQLGGYDSSDVKGLVKTATLRFESDHNWFDMDAGAGVYIDEHGGLSVHSCNGFKRRYSTKTYGINFCEFRPISSDFAPTLITDTSDGWIDLFEHESCCGRCIGLVGTAHTSLANFSNVYVGGQMMNNQISSVRFQLPKGTTYTLYNNTDFDVSNGVLELIGSGHVTTLPDLRLQSFGDKASSGRFTSLG